MNKEKYDSLDPAYQEAINQAVAEAIEEMKSQMVESDETNKQTLVDGGMTLIEYDDAFFQEILALDTVQALYDKIDADVNGLEPPFRRSLPPLRAASIPRHSLKQQFLPGCSS